MNQLIPSSALLLSTLLLLPACEKKEAEAGEAASPAASAAAAPAAAEEKKAAAGSSGSPKIGDSCEGLSASDGKLACEGNKIIFCSSYSKYKWTLQRECEEGTKCVAEGDSAASCK